MASARALWLIMAAMSTQHACGASCAGSTLFFSQYQEEQEGNGATGLNNYYQIFNPTDAVVNLADEYSIATCVNGCSAAGAAWSRFLAELSRE